MEKHGKTLEPEDDVDDDDMGNQVDENFKMFYQNERMDDGMDDQEMLLNDDENDLLKNDFMEDEMAIHQYSRDKVKMSPNNLISSTRKNTQQISRHQQSVGDYPQQQKRVASQHQNQFSKQ